MKQNKSRVFIIAEAGVNHNGSEEFALKLIEGAAYAGADAVKFQTFKADELVVKGTAAAEYQKKQTGMNEQHAMLKQLEMSKGLHEKIIDKCKAIGIEFISTPFDINSARMLLELGMDKIKIPSGELTNIPFIRELTRLNKPMILSTGMSSLKEVAYAISIIKEESEALGFKEDLKNMLTILHCTSNYPTIYEDVNLQAMQTMAEEFSLPVGYSDHTNGIFVSVIAAAMNAQIIEKHFTLDRNMPGPDHKASLEVAELKEMVKQIRQVEVCKGNAIKEPMESEIPVRDLVRRSVVLTKDKRIGEKISKDDVALLRPGIGIQPKDLDKIIGKKLKTSKKMSEVLMWGDIHL